MPDTKPSSHQLHLPIRLSPRQRRWAHASFALLWLSGALWLLFHYFFQVQGRFGPSPHPLEPWWLRLHGLAMMATLLTLGSLLIHHVRRAWQLGRNRLFGAVLTGIFAWLGGTGYALYYFSSDGNEAWLPLLHWVPGLSLPLVLVLHVRRGRARGKKRAVVVSHRHAPDSRPASPEGIGCLEAVNEG